MIRICHASIDENGKTKGGQPGEQGKEVCIRNWYNKPWGLVLRHPSESISDKIADVSEYLSSCNIGYNQDRRNTAHDVIKSMNYHIDEYKASGRATDTDCSAFVTLCCIVAGIKTLEYVGNAPTTRTMKSVFKAAGFNVLTASKYLKSDDYLRKGDILLSEGHHTVICLDNGKMYATNENVAYLPPYEGKSTSIVDGLNAVGVDSSKSNRKKIFEANFPGETYTGSAKQNTKMLEKLRSGLLIAP